MHMHFACIISYYLGFPHLKNASDAYAHGLLDKPRVCANAMVMMSLSSLLHVLIHRFNESANKSSRKKSKVTQ